MTITDIIGSWALTLLSRYSIYSSAIDRLINIRANMELIYNTWIVIRGGVLVDNQISVA
jgi:hypothetical protein